jgi:transcriptional regulator with XRE-family HTH domain
MESHGIGVREVTISGAQVKSARSLLGWAKIRLAGRAGVSEATVSRIENDLPITNSRYAAIIEALTLAGIDFSHREPMLRGDEPARDP